MKNEKSSVQQSLRRRKTSRPRGREILSFWGLGPRLQQVFVSGRPLAPLANFANGGPLSLLAAPFRALQALLALALFAMMAKLNGKTHLLRCYMVKR